MHKKIIFLACAVVLLSGLANSASAVQLRVDFAYPILRCPDHNNILECPEGSTETDPCSVLRHNRTLKEDWIPFVATGNTSWQFDLWRHDMRTMVNVDSSGLDLTVSTGYEGDQRMWVTGMQPSGDELLPAEGLNPVGDPIANSYVISIVHWGNNPGDPEGRAYPGSVWLTLSGSKLDPNDPIQPVKPGLYSVSSYHCDSGDLLDPGETFNTMPSVTVHAGTWGDFVDEGVIPIKEAYNVPIQHTLNDDELEMVTIDFIADGSTPVTIHYMSPPGWRGGGGAAVLNAFIIDYAPAGQSFKPKPMDGETRVHPEAILTWTPGEFAAWHDLYLGTDFNDVNDADTSSPVYEGNDVTFDGSDPNNPRYTYDPYGEDLLEWGQTYYWRVDEVNDACDDSPWKGLVWSFVVDDGTPINPSPGDEATGVAMDTNLVWIAGILSPSHDVYIGTDFDDVNEADTSSDLYKGSEVDVNDTDPDHVIVTYDPPEDFTLGETYYWRVDQVRPIKFSKGPVWSFTVRNYVLVDNFDSYDVNNPFVYDEYTGEGTWRDGVTNWTTSKLTLVRSPNDLPVRGSGTMEFGYDNYSYNFSGNYYAEAELPIAERSKDWTTQGVKAMSLWFHGQVDNDLERMYVALEDNVGEPNHVAVLEYPGDANDLGRQEWQEWNIDLRDFKQPKQTAANDVLALVIGSIRSARVRVSIPTCTLTTFGCISPAALRGTGRTLIWTGTAGLTWKMSISWQMTG